MSTTRGAVLVLAVALIAPGCSPRPVPPTAAPDRLLRLMGERLELMHDVARWKWNEGRPVADPARERQLLDRLAARAADREMDPEAVRAFFAAQIEAAKLVQQANLERWREEKRGRFARVPDLASLRRRIDALNDELLDALAATTADDREKLARRARPGVGGPEASRGERSAEGIDARVWETALAPLRDRKTAR